DGRHAIGFGGQRIGGRRTDDADRPDMGGMIMRDRALAGDGLAKRDAMLLGEIGKHAFRAGIAYAAAGNDQPPLRAPEDACRLGDPIPVGPRTPYGPAWAGCSCVTAPWPALVSQSGMPCFPATSASPLTAPE